MPNSWDRPTRTYHPPYPGLRAGWLEVDATMLPPEKGTVFLGYKPSLTGASRQAPQLPPPDPGDEEPPDTTDPPPVYEPPIYDIEDMRTVAVVSGATSHRLVTVYENGPAGINGPINVANMSHTWGGTQAEAGRQGPIVFSWDQQGLLWLSRAEGNRLVVFTNYTGQVVWSTQIVETGFTGRPDSTTSAAVVGNTLVVGGNRGDLRALDIDNDGSQLWHVSPMTGGFLSIAHNAVWTLAVSATDNLVAVNRIHQSYPIRAYSLTDGSVVWSYDEIIEHTSDHNGDTLSSLAGDVSSAQGHMYVMHRTIASGHNESDQRVYYARINPATGAQLNTGQLPVLGELDGSYSRQFRNFQVFLDDSDDPYFLLWRRDAPLGGSGEINYCTRVALVTPTQLVADTNYPYWQSMPMAQSIDANHVAVLGGTLRNRVRVWNLSGNQATEYLLVNMSSEEYSASINHMQLPAPPEAEPDDDRLVYRRETMIQGHSVTDGSPDATQAALEASVGSLFGSIVSHPMDFVSIQHEYDGLYVLKNIGRDDLHLWRQGESTALDTVRIQGFDSGFNMHNVVGGPNGISGGLDRIAVLSLTSAGHYAIRRWNLSNDTFGQDVQVQLDNFYELVGLAMSPYESSSPSFYYVATTDGHIIRVNAHDGTGISISHAIPHIQMGSLRLIPYLTRLYALARNHNNNYQFYRIHTGQLYILSELLFPTHATNMDVVSWAIDHTNQNLVLVRKARGTAQPKLVTVDLYDLTNDEFRWSQDLYTQETGFWPKPAFAPNGDVLFTPGYAHEYTAGGVYRLAQNTGTPIWSYTPTTSWWPFSDMFYLVGSSE